MSDKYRLVSLQQKGCLTRPDKMAVSFYCNNPLTLDVDTSLLTSQDITALHKPCL